MNFLNAQIKIEKDKTVGELSYPAQAFMICESGEGFDSGEKT